MASFTRPLRTDFCVCVYGGALPRKKRSHLVEFLTFAYNCRPFVTII